jgi:hypothetical protein
VWRRTDPDLHLIKQVEQVTTSALEGPARHFARIPSMGDHRRGRGPRISDSAIIIGCYLAEKQREQQWECCVRVITGLGGVNACWPIDVSGRLA